MLIDNPDNIAIQSINLNNVTDEELDYFEKNFQFRDEEEYNQMIAVNPDYYVNLFKWKAPYKNVYMIYTRPSFNDKIPLMTIMWIGSFASFAEVSFNVDKRMEQYMCKEILKDAKEIISLAAKQYPRLQAACVTAPEKISKRNSKFLEYLGFTKECTMKKYGFNQQDAFLYSLIS